MNGKIESYLAEIELTYGVEILLACETGSRAWGFPSPDSDYDVRVIYKHEMAWYLSLTEQKDSIDCFFENNEIDITGWDLRKTLRLLKKSNPPLLERLQSPIVYKSNDIFLRELNVIASRFYSRIATIHHYAKIAKNSLAEIQPAAPYKLKKFFYALRCSIACVWILEREEMPPIEFRQMLEQLNLPSSILDRILELILVKATVGESYFHSGEDELIVFMASCVARTDSQAQNLPSSWGKSSELDGFFRKFLKDGS